MPPPVETPETYKLTNGQFLSEIFKDLREDERPIVLGFRGAINATTRWGTGVPWSLGVPVEDDTLNWYFTLST